MSYFSMFPNISYDAKGNGVNGIYKDIFSRVKIRSDVKGDIYSFDYYDVRDGETPEMIAHKYYDDPLLHWTILIANDIVDYYSDWPMSVQRFEQYIKDKYPNPAGIHHYEVAQTSGDPTVMIDVGMNTTDYPSATAISFYTYEQLLQDEKRKIRLIQPDFIEDMVKEYELLLQEGN
tara:strand:+ start:137 stop:664 length:528 start_codon:yes stop_codon:yes gene_type:complete